MFNAGKEIKAMKHLTLHRIASSYDFILFVASSLLLPSFDLYRQQCMKVGRKGGRERIFGITDMKKGY
jgi:hypothetical protein